MKTYTLNMLLLACLCFGSIFGQDEDLQLTSKDSLVESSWIIGLGYNIVDDSGDVFDDLFSVNSQWNALPYPSRVSIGKYFKSGIGLEAIGSYNKYKTGKIIDRVVNDSDKEYWGIDARLTYDLNRLIGETAWFDPYIGIGAGYTNANSEARGTYNAIIGFRTWFSDRLGLDFNSSGKWAMGNTGTNHLQHAVGVVYQFDIEKRLSKSGEEKSEMIAALVKEKQRLNDSIAAVDRAKEAAALADILAKEKEKTRLAVIEKGKNDAENQRKQQIEKTIKDLGYVYFDLNSSYLNAKSKEVLKALAEVMTEYPELELKVTSHTDSRGHATYNNWLSTRRANRTVDYLVGLGVVSNRLMAEAYGENNLLNDCDDDTYCPEEKHQINRRSEFVIVKY